MTNAEAPIIQKIICRREPVAMPAEVEASMALPADLHPVLSRVYRARQTFRACELDWALANLLPPQQLKGMDEATTLLADVVQRQRRILIVADFDADGATSCALVVRALRLMGATDVHFFVPNRFEYGYGLTPEIVALAAERAPELIITVDNGISSVEGVRAAHDRGIAVLITDHHLPGSVLPEADAMVNPNQPGDTFPSKNLAGVGVAFYLMIALRARLRALNWFTTSGMTEPRLGSLLDLVALGTVADLVPLDYNNRILVAQGLARARAGFVCAGVRALLAVAGRAVDRLSAADLGFCVAPRLNAAGRLQDMTLGIECLLTDDPLAAAQMAAKLDALNRERRAIEAQMQAQAIRAVDNLQVDADPTPMGLCLFDESWHQGVIGLVAARMKERCNRPTIAFAPAGAGELKGSARSIAGLHIRDVLDTIAAHHPTLLHKFGGHAMAAGLSLARADLATFRQAFDAEVRHRLKDNDLQAQVLSDGELTPAELTLDFAQLLRDAGPWGQGYPEPIFDGQFDIVERRLVGDKHIKLLLRHAEGKTVDAIGFNLARNGSVPAWSRIHAAYKLEVHDYRGSRSVQLLIEHVEPLT